MNKSIDICTKVIYNIDNSKSPLCILRNYTCVKSHRSKTKHTCFVNMRQNYTCAKSHRSKTVKVGANENNLNYTCAKSHRSKTVFS